MFSEALKIEIKAYVWNEGETPIELVWDGPDNFDHIQHQLRDHLNEKDFGKIVAVRGTGLDADLTELHYRAFTDPFRGRKIVAGVTAEDCQNQYEEVITNYHQKVFSPRDLYQLKPADTSYFLWHFVSVHLQEELGIYDLDLDSAEEGKRIEIRTIADICHDGRRTWTLQTVWFDGVPVMVVNSSGRDGDEYHQRWITNLTQFGELLNYLRNFTKRQIEGFVAEDTIIPNMTEFYGGTIHDFYDVVSQRPIPAKVRIG